MSSKSTVDQATDRPQRRAKDEPIEANLLYSMIAGSSFVIVVGDLGSQPVHDRAPLCFSHRRYGHGAEALSLPEKAGSEDLRRVTSEGPLRVNCIFVSARSAFRCVVQHAQIRHFGQFAAKLSNQEEQHARQGIRHFLEVADLPSHNCHDHHQQHTTATSIRSFRQDPDDRYRLGG
ncbi:hypothetical protein PHSY_003275 [Pseudozyma hubeiensis SY62]|uniref:Uncharacterized protein n=1 Tax=Pseudozyma hubeiensis (strain SY62) TaxID=1305764 RepID=R9P318_PSEHS|nr:hypothetical protein PHSY_003275 [Pseudozyma hubeiensis SY62]GAC95699.1 hypothetical protein PHSY_003275 [Pseudozyma hubeiensis SY62]